MHLRLGLSHLREHSFQNSLNRYCTCENSKIEARSHFLLHSSNFSDKRLALLSPLRNVDGTSLQRSDAKLIHVAAFW